MIWKTIKTEFLKPTVLRIIDAHDFVTDIYIHVWLPHSASYMFWY